MTPGIVVSGGQTGADRAALDAARARGIPTGGWVPRGRLAEDGPIPASYTGLVETVSDAPEERTALNVRDSDGTLIVSHGPLEGGTALTRATADGLGRPSLHVDLSERSQAEAVVQVRDWIDACNIARLNVAGPRASEDPDVYDATFALLSAVLEPSRARGQS
ncbi:MAG: putative molybdenum carrier protein [Vicinamibacterales bacterium]